MSKTVLTVDTERLLKVKRNRQVQLQRWNFYEKELQKVHGNDGRVNQSTHKGDRKRIEFGKDIILLEAVSRNDINEVTELLSQGVDPDSATVDGLTGLHQCCIDDFLEMARLLIQYNADVNAKDSEKWTPLHAAATCDNSQMCLLLSKHDADFLALNSDGNMPYDICEGDKALKAIEIEMARKGITQQQIDDARMVPEQKMLRDIKMLIHNNGDLNQLDNQGAAMIHIACSLGYNEVVQTLLEAAANYSLPDKDGWLPIHLAACWSHVDIVEFLAVFGADINLTNSSGDTIFDLCEPDIRDRLLYIKDNISEIRKSYNFNRLPPNKSFRRSRGSSVRRTSVRQKNMISKKEAKEEYIVLNQTINLPDDKPNLVEIDSIGHIPTTIEECSDVESLEVNPQPSKVTVHSIKVENNSSKQALLNSNTNSSISIPTSVNNHSVKKSSTRTNTSSPILPPKSNITPLITTDKSNNHTVKSDTKICSFQLENKVDHIPRKLSFETNSKVDALDKPRYVFKSNTESWDNTKEHKRSRKRECCVLL